MERDTWRTGKLPGSPAPVECLIDRRRFLLLVGSATAYAALRPQLAWARRVASQEPSIQPWSLPADVSGNPVEITRALLAAAVLAPSHWNTQPWRFESEQNTIRIVGDLQRWLPAIDPDQRNLHLSLGAALENLLIAARAYGLRPSATYLPHDGAGGVAAEVVWAPGEARRDRIMFSAITARRTNRHEFDGRGIYLQSRAQLSAQVPDDFTLHWMDDRDRLRGLADVVHDAVSGRVLDVHVQSERYRWMRFGDDAANRRGDGITLDKLEMQGLAHWLAGRYFNPESWMLRFGAENAAKQARSQVRSSGAVALLTTPRGGRTQWLAAGQVYERLALTAATLGIAQQPISEPLETDSGRAEVLRRFGAAGEQPLMMVRLGHATQPGPSLRRSVAVVSSFRTT